jgi:hypothetical protein
MLQKSSSSYGGWCEQDCEMYHNIQTHKTEGRFQLVISSHLLTSIMFTSLRCSQLSCLLGYFAIFPQAASSGEHQSLRRSRYAEPSEAMSVIGAAESGRRLTDASTFSDPKHVELKEHNLSYWCSQPIQAGVPTFKGRGELGRILEEEGLQTGAELGVQRGVFAGQTLQQWPSCTDYLLVDVWAPLENYADIANVGQNRQDTFMEEALGKTSGVFGEKVRHCRDFTSECVKHVPDESLDYIYVDARHDFLGVYTDLVEWWPKLKHGGILAGHDYVTQDDGPANTGQDWTVNFDGTKDETGTVVKGAVDLFASQVCRQVTVAYRESHWNTWALRK